MLLQHFRKNIQAVPWKDTDPNKTDRKKIVLQFTTVCCFLFVISVIATIHFCSPMCCDMKMPGGWTMSMMWMMMPGKTWGSSLPVFLVMWLAMMVAMMMPAALPMFLTIKRTRSSLCYTALGYFIVWMVAGIPVYVLGIVLADAAMQSASLSNAVPLLFGITLMLAGLYQFSGLKMVSLLHCRSPFGCAISENYKTGFQLGCRQGISCCICCAGLMTVQIVLGIMSLRVMAIIAVAITLEKLLPRPDITARVFGVIAIIAGVVAALQWIMVNKF